MASSNKSFEDGQNRRAVFRLLKRRWVYMRNSFLILIFTTLFVLNVRADSRILIEKEGPEKCEVASDEILHNGILAAKVEVESQNNLKLDSINFIQSKDRKNSCEFLFSLSLAKKHLARAEIVLLKNDWQVISRVISEGHDTFSW